MERAARSSPFKASSGASRRRPRRARRVPVPSRAGRTAAAAAAPLRARARAPGAARAGGRREDGLRPLDARAAGPQGLRARTPRARRRGRGRRRVVLGQIHYGRRGRRCSRARRHRRRRRRRRCRADQQRVVRHRGGRRRRGPDAHVLLRDVRHRAAAAVLPLYLPRAPRHTSRRVAQLEVGQPAAPDDGRVVRATLRGVPPAARVTHLAVEDDARRQPGEAIRHVLLADDAEVVVLQVVQEVLLPAAAVDVLARGRRPLDRRGALRRPRLPGALDAHAAVDQPVDDRRRSGRAGARARARRWPRAATAGGRGARAGAGAGAARAEITKSSTSSTSASSPPSVGAAASAGAAASTSASSSGAPGHPPAGIGSGPAPSSAPSCRLSSASASATAWGSSRPYLPPRGAPWPARRPSAQPTKFCGAAPLLNAAPPKTPSTTQAPPPPRQISAGEGSCRPPATLFDISLPDGAGRALLRRDVPRGSTCRGRPLRRRRTPSPAPGLCCWQTVLFEIMKDEPQSAPEDA